MGDGGLHLAAQSVVLPLHPAHPLLHAPAQVLGLAVGLVQNVLGPAVGLQLHAGGALLHGLIGGGLRLQGCHSVLQAVPLLAQGGQLPLLGLLPVLAGGQGLLGLLQLLAQAVPLPVEDGELFLLLRRLGRQLPPLLLSRLQVLLQFLLPLGVLRRRLLQIVQHILPVKAAQGGASKWMVHGAPRLRPASGHFVSIRIIVPHSWGKYNSFARTGKATVAR